MASSKDDQPTPTADPRIEAVARAIGSVCSDGNSNPYAVARDVLAAADAVDPVRHHCDAAHLNWSALWGKAMEAVTNGR